MRQQPPVSNEELFRLFSQIDQSTQDWLIERLWNESDDKTNPRSDRPSWGKKTVQNNPRCLMPLLQAEIEHLRNPTIFLIIDQKQAGTDFQTEFHQLSAEQQRRCAEDFCRFIALTGYDEVSFDNMSIFDGKIKLHKLPLKPADNIQSARANARTTLNWLARRQCKLTSICPILRIAAEQQILMLDESEIDFPKTIQFYRAFAKLMKDPSATTEQKQVAFQRLPIKVQEFLYFSVWSGIKDKKSETKEDKPLIAGKMRLEADINILTQLQNSSGMNILEQFEVRYSLTEVLNILRLTKRMLSQENARPETLHLFVDTLEKTLLGSAMLAPIAQHLTQKIESIQSTHGHLSNEDLFEEIKTALIGSPGQDGILDFYIRSIDATKRELSIPAIKHRVKMNREFDPEHFPVRPTAREKIQITTPPKLLEELPEGMRVLVVAYECAQYGLKYGGLGESVYGIATSLKNRGCEVTILTPKFSGLPQALRERIEREGTPSTVRHEVSGTMKEDRVLTIQQDGITLAYLEDTSPDRNRFDVPGGPQIYEDGVLGVPGKEWHGLKERMAYVGSATAEYIVANKDQFDAVVYNDWHAAYAVDRIAHRYFDRWTCGEFPANVFIIHNNSYGCQGVYGVEEADALHMFGDQRKGLNVMAEVVELAERSTTVSETFAQEMQDGGLSAGIGPWVRKSAHDDKFKGIINGSNPDLWNPSTNPVLKNWRDPVTGDAVDLSFSPQTPDLVAHKRLVREQL
ncbi:MAG: glycogen/starch synthase, partial [Verrucomicrobia bacterium]|nr:glycogen/starch synthase [Verrucomicrobiota bacterium]